LTTYQDLFVAQTANSKVTLGYRLGHSSL